MAQTQGSGPPTDPSRLAPEDAVSGRLSKAQNGSALQVFNARRSRERRRNRSRSSRRRKDTTWKKLLWVKHPGYPDNYTDEATFLDHLQRNPRLRPYEFWPLVANSTVIVQQLCAVIVFVCCFSGIIQERVSPITIVTCGTALTVLGWVLWDIWVGREEALKAATDDQTPDVATPNDTPKEVKENALGLGLAIPNGSTANVRRPVHSRQTSGTSTRVGSTSEISMTSAASISRPPSAQSNPQSPTSPYERLETRLSPHNQQRFATVKSAVLIYCALLGLSPILKSLTKSTASDSIWAISFWLMCINIFFFDYGGGVGATFPASLSTNAALMASTVLASRLSSTTHVFSLTLFSIEVFGLFPVFRRYLRHVSGQGHNVLTGLLVASAGGGVSLCLSKTGGIVSAIFGIIMSCLLTGLVMGLCSWWLIGLQRYKNEIHGPWDPARPIVRRRWD